MDLSSLNQQQRAAVEATNGPVLIVAGPGTGKTKTLTMRIAHLIESGVSPGHMLALTFTIKAAAEMKSRVAQLLGTDAKLPMISTFHGVGYRALQHAHRSVELATDVDRLEAIRSVPRPRELSGVSVRELALRISQYKGAVMPPDDTAISRAAAAYNQELSSRGLLDYDDLLSQAYQLLQRGPEASLPRFRVVLVDEFQDTSELQWEIVKLLAGTDAIFVIGDPRQSIYSFRGAGGDMFARFRRDFPNHREVSLDINYRSARSIVRLGSAIFPDALPAKAFAPDEGAVRAVQTLNEYAEADLVLAIIEAGIGGSTMLSGNEGSGRTFSDYAVVYRTHRVARHVQQRLGDAGIPVQVVGEGSPYDLSEVRIVIDVMRWFARGDLPTIKGLRSTQVLQLCERIDRTQPPSKLVHDIATVFGLVEAKGAVQRIGQLAATMVRFDERKDALSAAVNHIDVVAQQDFYDQTADAVTLLTIHASKGLEFEHVIVIGAEEGILPHIRKGQSPNIEEEKRLFFVAATRAKQQLDILYVKRRSGEPAAQSRFIQEIPAHLLPREVDPRINNLEKKLYKRQQRGRQATLF